MSDVQGEWVLRDDGWVLRWGDLEAALAEGAAAYADEDSMIAEQTSRLGLEDLDGTVL